MKVDSAHKSTSPSFSCKSAWLLFGFVVFFVDRAQTGQVYHKLSFSRSVDKRSSVFYNLLHNCPPTHDPPPPPAQSSTQPPRRAEGN